ncbi:unnamed protein product, partial [Closterium sp. Naga37s-1]
TVLQELQNSWNTRFGGWQAGSDCTQAQGLTCDSNGMITSMRLKLSSAVDFQPASVTQLSHLTQLEASNSFKFPTGSLYNITWLKSLAVDCLMDLNLPIPGELANLSQLTRLRICKCGLKDELQMFTRLPSLLELDVPSNSISYIRDINYRFPSHEKLNLSSNLIVAGILPSLTRLTGLTSLDLSSNQLEGYQVLESFSLPTLQFLNLSNNGLSGSLPESLTTMSNLVTLSVASNYMEGTIPPALGRLRNLSTLVTNPGGLTCPDNYTSCGVPQNASSGFCRTCPDFCTT